MKSRWMLVLAFGLAVAPAWAQKGGVVRLIVPFATGGPTDIAARVVAPYLGERTGRPWVVENKVGATGAIGTELVARAHRAGVKERFYQARIGRSLPVRSASRTGLRATGPRTGPQGPSAPRPRPA